MDEQIKLDLDARQYIEVRIASKDYRVYAPSLARTPELAMIGERIEANRKELEGGKAEIAKDFMASIADYIAHFSADIPREFIMELDLVRALKFMTAVQALLPKGEASRAPAGS